MSIPINPNTNQPIDNHRPSRKQREQHPNAKLSQQQVSEIRRLAAEGVNRKSLVVRFGVSKSTIGAIIKGNAWRG
ncbi:hypothetical protein [Microcoleus sp. B3-D7]|uniref:hypothetical protein n=1 Tax=Microcoleus sp. B3-D7 TaxID=2818659 RepID=UPI002FD1FFAF